MIMKLARNGTHIDRFLKWFYSYYLKRPLPGAIPPIIQGVPIHLFDLYKLMDCMGGYLSVQLGQEFGALAKILGLTRSEGEDIRKCYMTYLEAFVSYYKTARAPKNPMIGEEDLESLEEYQWNLGKEGASYAMEKGKERLEHFGIELEERRRNDMSIHRNQFLEAAKRLSIDPSKCLVIEASLPGMAAAKAVEIDVVVSRWIISSKAIPSLH
ncbi:ARID DNA-binding domain-containing protein [Tanacetum coccineum]